MPQIPNRKEFLDFYIKLNEKQKKEIFTDEQIVIFDNMVTLEKMFNDPAFFYAVQSAVAEAVYEDFRNQK
jgi:hypothetical protein|nr:MAG TPA: hypothetical protein [Caudoviricetes sp.]